MKQIRGLQNFSVQSDHTDNEKLNEEIMAKVHFLRRIVRRCSGSPKGYKYNIGK